MDSYPVNTHKFKSLLTFYHKFSVFSKAFKKKFGMSPKNYKTHKEMMDKFNEKQVDDPV